VRVGIARTRGRTFCFLLSNVASESISAASGAMEH
jgi:hypothetical protein